MAVTLDQLDAFYPVLDTAANYPLDDPFWLGLEVHEPTGTGGFAVTSSATANYTVAVSGTAQGALSFDAVAQITVGVIGSGAISVTASGAATPLRQVSGSGTASATATGQFFRTLTMVAAAEIAAVSSANLRATYAQIGSTAAVISAAADNERLGEAWTAETEESETWSSISAGSETWSVVSSDGEIWRSAA